MRYHVKVQDENSEFFGRVGLRTDGVDLSDLGIDGVSGMAHKVNFYGDDGSLEGSATLRDAQITRVKTAKSFAAALDELPSSRGNDGVGEVYTTAFAKVANGEIVRFRLKVTKSSVKDAIKDLDDDAVVNFQTSAGNLHVLLPGEITKGNPEENAATLDALKAQRGVKTRKEESEENSES